jgi:hypothetical protein
MTSTPVARSLLFWGLAMAARIQAGECSIIVVNSNSFTARHKGPERMNWLLSLAEKLQIPVYFVNLNSHSESEIRTQLPKIPKQGEKLIRSKLLISGSDLEQGVSAQITGACGAGYRVFAEGVNSGLSAPHKTEFTVILEHRPPKWLRKRRIANCRTQVIPWLSFMGFGLPGRPHVLHAKQNPKIRAILLGLVVDGHKPQLGMQRVPLPR